EKMTVIRNYYAKISQDDGNGDGSGSGKLRNEMEVTMKNFSIYSTMKVVDDDKTVISKLEDINKERAGFKKIVEESIIESTKLHTFADNLIVFADSCEKDKDISNEDLLEALKSLKDDAINNRRSAMNLKREIEKVKQNLGNIRTELINYNEKIANNEKDMASTTRNELIEKETQLEKSNPIAVKSLIAAGAGLGVSLIALPFTGGVSAIPACIEVTICAEILFGLGLGVLGLGTTSIGIVKGIPTAQYYYINYKLQQERDKLADQIGELKQGLENVHNALGKFESQLSTQETYIQILIEKFQKHENDGDGRIPKIIARGIIKRWKEITQESTQYASIMRELLHNDFNLENQPSKLTFQNFRYAGEALCDIWHHVLIFGRSLDACYVEELVNLFENLQNALCRGHGLKIIVTYVNNLLILNDA
ncbi:5034_t:CDS:2, partial [Entrophospora sp. SA101]